MNCNIVNADGKWLCQTCGMPGKPGMRRNCVTKARSEPTLTRRIWNYTEARKRWERAGCPVRSDSEVDHIAAICRRCEWFNRKSQICAHENCGCKVDGKDRWFGNKLRWSTEHCPIGKWGQHSERSADETIPVERRNLICHIAPVSSNDVWLRNVRQLQARWSLFNGQRVVAVATGRHMVNPQRIQEELPHADIITLPNDRTLRETASLPLLLERVASDDPTEATFYCHAKGAFTVGDVAGVMYWRNSMYHALLDNWPSIEQAINNYIFVGTHFRRHTACKSIYPDGITRSGWHFAGTFWWFRNRPVFQREPLARLQRTGYGTEAFPATICEETEVKCIDYCDMRNPYNPCAYDDPIEDEGFTAPNASAAIKVELGGGDKPKGEGYVNVDQAAGPDVDHVVDLSQPFVRLPFEANTVGGVYTAHCLEHIADLRPLFRELSRICLSGAHVIIVVPHWNSEGAMMHGHACTIGDLQVDHWTSSAVEYWWSGCNKRLRLFNRQAVKAGEFDEAKECFPQLSDEQIMKFIPNTCHEVHYHFHMVPK